ncbi:hypothetical protein NXC24_CH03101 [Rhizobium sp. NXC24]|nr:hypothetical protein NXC24_CH03101 [Rhizobium sp. NXC24]
MRGVIGSGQRVSRVLTYCRDCAVPRTQCRLEAMRRPAATVAGARPLLSGIMRPAMLWDLITIAAIFALFAAVREGRLIIAKAKASHWNNFQLR